MSEDQIADQIVFKLYDDLGMTAPIDGKLYRGLCLFVKSQRAELVAAQRTIEAQAQRIETLDAALREISSTTGLLDGYMAGDLIAYAGEILNGLK